MEIHELDTVASCLGHYAHVSSRRIHRFGPDFAPEGSVARKLLAINFASASDTLVVLMSGASHLHFVDIASGRIHLDYAYSCDTILDLAYAWDRLQLGILTVEGRLNLLDLRMKMGPSPAINSAADLDLSTLTKMKVLHSFLCL